MKQIKLFRADNTFDLEDFVIQEKEFLQQHSIFDDAGNTLEEYTYREDGSIEHLYKYQYNNEARVTEELLIEDDETTGNRTFVYNEVGNIIEETIHYLDESTDTITYTYNEEGKLIGKKTIDSDGEEGNFTENKYLNGLVVSEIEYDSDSKVVFQRDVTYNSDQLIIEETIENTDGTLRVVNEYDESKKLTLRKQYNSENHLIERTSFVYDQNGLLIENCEENMDGIETTKIEYDEKGSIIQQLTTDDQENVLQIIERTYDTEGRPVTVSVNSQRPNRSISNHYRLRYVYE